MKDKTREMQRQLEMVDIDGMTLLMHASCGSSSAAFQALSQSVQASKVKYESDADNVIESIFI